MGWSDAPEVSSETPAWASAPEVGKPPAPAKAAPSSLTDTALTGLQSLVGGGKSLLQGFGADVAPAESLDELQKWLGKQMTPERQAELKRQAEETKAAAKSGDIGREILTAGKNVAAAPVLTTAQAVGSSVVPVAAGLGVAALGAAIGAPLALAAAVGIGAKYAIGALQGAGEAKGNIYEKVQEELIARGVPKDVAKQQALQSQEYLGQNWGQLLTSGVIGGIAGGTGLEKTLTGLFGKKTAADLAAETARKAATGYAPRVATAVGKEVGTEAAQSGQGQVATNVALTRAGVPTPTFQGVAGEATTGALSGALGAGPISAYTERGAPAAPTAPPTAGRAPTAPRYSAVSPPAPVGPAPLPDISTLGYGDLTKLGESLRTLPQTPAIKAQRDTVKAELEARDVDYVTKQREAAAAEKAAEPTPEAPAAPISTTDLQQVEMRAALPEGELAPQLDLFGNPLAPAPDVAPAVETTVTPKELEAQGQQRLPLRRTPEGQPTTTPVAPVAAPVAPAPAPVAPAPAPVAPAPAPVAPAPVAPAPVAPAPVAPVAPVPAPAAPIAEPIKRPAPVAITPETAPTVLTPDVFKALGIGPTAVIRKSEIAGKDIANIEDATQIKRDLEAYRDAPGRSEGIKTKIDAYLARPEFKAIPEPVNVQPAPAPIPPTVQAPQPGGGQPSVEVPSQPAGAAPVQPGTPAPAAQPAPPVGLGLAPAGQPAGTGTTPARPTPPALAPAGGMFGALVKPGAPDITAEAPAPAPAAPAPASTFAWQGKPSVGRELQTEETIAAEKAAKAAAIRARQQAKQAEAQAKRDAAEAAKQGKPAPAPAAPAPAPAAPELTTKEQLDAVMAEIKDVQDKAKALLSTDGRLPSAGSARRKQYDALRDKEHDLIQYKFAPLDRKYSAEKKTAQAPAAPAPAPAAPAPAPAAPAPAPAAPAPAPAAPAPAAPTVADWALEYSQPERRVVYADDEVGLIRAFNMLGRYVYIGLTNAGMSTRSDIESYTGTLFTPEQTARLLDARRKTVFEESKKAAKNLDGPFTNATSNVVKSDSVDQRYADYLQELMQSLGLKDIRVFLVHPEDVHTPDAADRYKLYGNYASAQTASNEGGEEGSNRVFGKDKRDFYIAVNSGLSETKTLEIIAHELGHSIEKVAYDNAPAATKAAIRKEYEAWLQSTKGKTGRELVQMLRNRETADTQMLSVPESKQADEMRAYWTSFAEWFADNVSRWATTADKPLTITEKFFSKVGQMMRDLVAIVTGRQYPPAKTVASFLDAMGPDSAKAWIAGTSTAAQPSTTAQASTSKPQATQDAEDTIAAMGRTLPEEDKRSYAARVKDTVAEFTPKREGTDSWITTFANKAADMLDASEPLKRAVREEARATMPEGEATDLLLQLSLSQSSHANSLADAAIQTGGLKYNPETYKFQTTKSDANLQSINAEYGKMMETYGITLPEARYYASTALESKRMDALYKVRDKMLADADTLDADGKKAGAKKLRDKAEAYVFHMEPDEVAEGLKLFQTMPEIQKIDDIKQDMRSWIRNLLQQTGVWSEEHGQWMLDNAEWIPFNREFADTETIQSGFNKFVKGLQVKAKEQAFKGSMREVHDVVDNFSNWASYSVRSAIANQKAQELAQASLEFLPDTEVRKVSTPEKGAADRTVSYLENGNTKYLEFESAAKAGVFRGMESFGRSTIPFIGGMLDWTSNVFRASITNFPLFPLYQLPMDAISAVFISGLKPKYAFKIPLTAVAEAVRTMTGKSTARETLREYGAVGVSDYNAMTQRTNSEVEAGLKKLSTWGKYQNLMQDVNMGADNSVRQAVYLAARDAGLTEAEAIEKAFEIINFRTRLGSGALTQMARNIVFFNSFLAATRATLKVLSSEGISPGDKTQARKSLLSNMAWLAGISFVMALANVGDEEYEKMSRAEQASKLTLPGMHGWGIPMRPDIFTLPKFLAESIVRQFSGKYADDPAKLRKNLWDVTRNSILSGPMPVAQPIKLAVEMATNYSFFTQRPIVGQGLEKLESYMQYSTSTSEASKFIGETTKRLLESAGIESQGLSPAKLDYFIRGALGMYGGAVMLLSNSLVGNKPSESIRDTVASVPGMSRIAVKEFDSQIKNDFYDLAKQIDTAVTTVRKLESTGKIPEAKEYFKEKSKLLQYREPVQKIQQNLGEVRTAITQTSERTDWDKPKKDAEIRRLRILERQFLQRQESLIKEMRTKALG